MPYKFAASLMFMFNELPELVDKYSAAKAAGFNAVDGSPYSVPLDKLVEVKERENIEQALINSYPGTFVNGELGTTALPGRQEEFKEELDISIKYAKGLKCSNIHIFAAVIPPHDPADESKLLQDMEDVFVENLRYAADKLQKEGIVALIEPINPFTDHPDYFLTKQSQGIEIIKKVNHPNLKLLLDFYHAQFMDGYLTRLIKEYLPLIGYIQISQVPERGEPDSPGEINYPYIFKLLEEVKYDGYIGCEYKPSTEKTADSLGWMKKYTE
ncbi:putative hydroxypyruvate isomerase [Glandiceps talaboti]